MASINMGESSNRSREPRWKQVFLNPDRSQQKSILSKDSSRHSRYTPTRHHAKSPDQKFDLNVLKEKIPSMKSFTDRSENADNSKLISTQKNSTVNIQRMSSMGSLIRQSHSSILDKYNTRWGNLMEMKKEKQEELSNENEFLDKNIEFKMNSSEIRAPLTERRQKIQYLKPNQRFKTDKLESILNQYQQKKIQSELELRPLKGDKLEVEQIFKEFLDWIKNLQEQISYERIQINKILEEKQKHFLEVKQYIYKTFALKQKQIKNPQLRIFIEEYLPKKAQQSKPLMRVTSQKIFKRIPDFLQTQRDSLGDRTQIKSTSRADYRSVNSKANKLIKDNFNTIFATLNEMKKKLHEDEPEVLLQKSKQKKLHFQNMFTTKQSEKKIGKDEHKKILSGLSNLKTLRKSMGKDDKYSIKNSQHIQSIDKL